MNSESEPSEIEEKNFTPSLSFSSLPDVRYCYGDIGFWWYDGKYNHWSMVNGLNVLYGHFRCGNGMIEMANYGGKLLIIWDEFVYSPNYWTNIWCALIAFEKRNGDEAVWGKVEWANIVLTVPAPVSCVLVRHAIQSL